MSFNYGGENAFMDELQPAPWAEAFFRNPVDNRYHAVSCQDGTRRTIACSFEFGGLGDAAEPSTKLDLLRRYAQFFGLPILSGAPNGEGELTARPARTALLPNDANPFNGRTEIRFDLATSGHLRLSIYDLRGRLIRRLVDDPMEAGCHRLCWDGRNEAGLNTSAGVYFLWLETAHQSASRRLLRIR